jgi:hypothetical protein
MNKYILLFTLVGITSAHAMNNKEHRRKNWQQKREFQQSKSRNYQQQHNMLPQPSRVKPQERPYLNDTRQNQRQ